ncbi:MAG: bifunctional (p)ppGpp synthetase/guanosine-3',5'-bis(diphosphate) 3'-pyrophosphohydrolase, partial [Bacteroidales bacterium]|nr:bifunctional (p)ppGpp synthetase/guanosine-3',5'-bis(diphosphate) 3'-pyrophosphohydrolase [Bacteroidales bacterium]
AFMPEYKREKILSETMYIFIPLAHRLGLYNIKSEMENIWMQFNEPHEYVRIQGILDGIVADKSDNINRLVRELGQITEKAGIKARILKRLKTPYSIWRKMERQNVPFEEIFDIYAVRIIFEPKEGVSERELCWSIFSQITERYKYNPARVRDWVSEPKVNGYESLHLTVMFLGIWIEVQIRSERMNSIAERGLAAHWAYKDGSSAGSPDADMDRWLKYVQDILENPDANALQFLDNIHKELLTSEIFVFTPTGESRSLPKGATALDFAFYIHSQIGRHAIAAKVNMKLVTLSTVLSNGDQVEIITSDSALPKREWLDFLSTSKARSCLVSALSETGQNNVRKGRELLTEQLAMRGIRVHTRVMRKLLDYYKIGGGKDELYTKIAIGLIDLADLDTVLKTNARERDVQMWGFKLLTPVSQGKVDKKQQFLLSENVDAGTISFRTSDCCHPIPGDTVMGVIGADGIVTIHKTTCQNYINIASTQGGSLVAVRWSRQFVMSFLARIAIGGIDRIGVLGDISDKISNLLSINIRKISIEAHDEIFEGYIDLYVHDRSALDNVIKALSEIKGMEKVNRIEID